MGNIQTYHIVMNSNGISPTIQVWIVSKCTDVHQQKIATALVLPDMAKMGTGHRSTGSCIARICLDHVIARGLPLRKLIPILLNNCGQLRFGKLTERCGKSQKIHVISSFPLGHDLLPWWFFHIFRFFKPSLSRMERCGYCSQPVSRANCCSR